MSCRHIALATLPLIVVSTLLVDRCRATSISVDIDVENHSFEEPLVPSDGDPDTVGIGDDFITANRQMPTGWKVKGPHDGQLGQLTFAPGSYFVELITLPPDSSEQAHWSNESDTYLYQTLTAPLEANTQYVLRVDLGDRMNATFPDDVQIRLGLGNSPGTSLLSPESMHNPLPPEKGWTTWENTYVTGADPSGLGQLLRVELVTGGHQALFDNVRLEAVQVPEPGTLLLSALALIGVASPRRRRRCG